MTIKYKNSKGLNERKSNQSSAGLNLEYIDELLDEKKFGAKDQQRVEDNAGEGGMTSGDSFDNIVDQKRGS